MNSLDARAKYTKKVIGDSFLSLLREKAAAKITVTELCQRAQINRATFYKHYMDIPHLLEQQVEDIMEQIRQLILQHPYQEFEQMLLDLLLFMRQNGERFFVLGSENADSGLPMKAFDACYQAAYPILARNYPTQDQGRIHMLYHYLSQGCGGVLGYWLRSGMAQEPEEVAAFLVEATVGTVRGCEFPATGAEK